MLEIFKFTFGNIAGFSSWVKKLTAFGAVSQLENVFYNSFQKCLSDEKAKVKAGEKTTLQQLEWLVRLERKRLVALFNLNIQNVSNFREALTKPDFIELLIQNFLKILDEEHSQSIDSKLAQRLIRNALSGFQETLFNQLSERQGIYVLLYQVFESHEVIEQIRANIDGQRRKLDEISIGVEATREAIGGVNNGLVQMENRLLEAISKSKTEDFVNSLIAEYKDRLNEGLELLKIQNYYKAEQVLLELKSKLERDQVNDNKLMFLTIGNLGKSRERLGKFQVAGQNYIEALVYAPNSSNAIYQALVGYRMLNQPEKAEELSEELKLHHPNTLQNFVIQLNEENCNIEDVIDNLPTNLISNSELNYSLAKAYLRKDNIEKYKIYMLKAIANRDDNGLLYKPILAYNISYTYSSRFHSVKETFIPEYKKSDLRLAIKLYKEVWEVHGNTDLNKEFIGMPINISTVYSALGLYEEAIKWIDVALNVEETPSLYSQKIYFLKKWGKQDDLIQMCREINDFTHPDYHDVLMIFAESLFNTYKPENQEEAISRLEKFIKNHPDSLLIDRAIHFLSNLYLSCNRLEKMNSLLEKAPVCISVLALKGRLAFAKEEFEKVNQYAEEALNLIDENTTDTELSELAISLMESEKFAEAVVIFEKFLSPAEPSYLSECLIHCYKESGNFNKVIAHCKESYEAIGITTYLTKELINTYVYIKDFRAAFDLMKLYCSTYEEDVEMLLRLGELTFYLEEETKDILSKIQKIPLAQLSVFSVQRIASMLLQVGKKAEVLNLVYEMRRLFDTAEAHQAYVFISTKINQTKEELRVNEVGLDTVVFLEKENAFQITYIIENRVDANKARHEINVSDPLFEKLKAKKVGDIIPWGENNFLNVEQTVRVSKILTKDHYAFLQSIELLGGKFSDDPNLKIVIGNGLESIKTFLDKNLEQNRKRQEAVEQVHSFYRKSNVPLGFVAFYENINPILLWHKFINDESIGINCSSGFEEETVEVFLHLKNANVEFCCDVTSILALHHLELGQWINTFYGKIHISYSTLELVKNLLIQKEEELKQNSFQIIEKDGQEFRYEKTRKEKEATLKYFTDLLSFVEKYCHPPSPVNLRKEGRIEEHQRKVEIYENSFYDTVLIAQENNFVLLSDDYVFREVTKNDLGIKALGTVDLIKFQKQNNEMISHDFLNEKLVKLLQLNYKNIAVKEDVLYAAIRLDNFKVCHHFFELNTNNYGHSLLKVFHFMNRLIMAKSITEDKKIKAIHEIMSVLITNFFPNLIFRSFRYLSQQTHFQTEILFEILEVWYKTNVATIKPQIQLEDFAKLDIRTGTIISVKPVYQAGLIEVMVDFGFDKLKSILPDDSEIDNTTLVGKSVQAIINFKTQNSDDTTRRCHILVLQNEYADVSFLTSEHSENGLCVK